MSAVNHKRYDFQSNEVNLNFEFISTGPKGHILKVVRYSPQNANGRTYFNLAFGDWNESENTIDDHSTSNNQDSKKILATVAATVLKFTETYPDMPVYARGTTATRTRLYQMAIAANLQHIRSVVEIYGLTKHGEWKPFQTGINYDAFMAWRKKVR